MINWTTLVALVRKEFLQALRDRRMLAMLLAVPVIQVTLFGYAANLELDHVETVIVDQDRTGLSRELAAGFGAEGTFETRSIASAGEAERELLYGGATLAIIIPKNYERDVLAERRVRVQALIDGSDPSRANSASSAVEQYVRSRNAPRRDLAKPIASIALEPRLLFNPGLKSKLFMVPGTAASVLVIITTIVTAMGLAREREVGTLDQLLVTPMSPATLLCGKTVPYAIFGLVDELLILLVGNLLFDVPARGLGVVFLATLAYLVTTLALGLLIATLARTQQQALMGGFFFLLPAILLSGFLTSVESMPAWVKPLTLVNPVRHFIDLIRSVLLRSASFEDVAPPFLALCSLGLGLLVLASLRFRRQLA